MSKELEAFNKIKNISCYMGGEYIGESFEVYEDELNIIEKSLKALEIIKEKNVDTLRFKVCDNAYQYNECRVRKVAGYKDLSEDEFDLLKEVLL